MNRGPYKQNRSIFDQAVELRKQGLGYLAIGKIVGKHQCTIRKWVKDIPAPGAHARYSLGLLKSFDDLKSKDQRKKCLIRERGHVCEWCHNTIWLTKPITLEMDHINGIKTDNRRENLRLLCPNCHSQTPTWKRKKTSL